VPIPTFDKMLRPILELSSAKDITRRTATQAMEEHFHLTPEERAALIPSEGSTYAANRTGWAMTFLTKGGLIEKVAPNTYRVTALGNKFMAAYPSEITEKDLRTIPGWKESWAKGNRKQPANLNSKNGQGTTTPQEAIDDAVRTLQSDLRSRLLDEVLKQSPAFFERLVLDVLVTMGYGGAREDAAHHLGKSNDEGIDGRINQDPLGLDQIMVQAKRYDPKNTIDRKTIQAFIGSLTGQGVAKGVFITTSSFAASAEEFVHRGSNTKIVLIDGDTLLDLMIRHKIGVHVERTVDLLSLDQNYFEDE
jgi:restriction system protein